MSGYFNWENMVSFTVYTCKFIIAPGVLTSHNLNSRNPPRFLKLTPAAATMKEFKPDVYEQSGNFYYKGISAKNEATVRSFISFIFDPNSFLSRLIAFDERCQNS